MHGASANQFIRLNNAEKTETVQSRSPPMRNLKLPGELKAPKRLNSKKKAQSQQIQNNETKKPEVLLKKPKEKNETLKARKSRSKSISRNPSRSHSRTPDGTESSFVIHKSQSPLLKRKPKKLKKKDSKKVSSSVIAEPKNTIGIIAAPLPSVSSQVSAENEKMYKSFE